MNSIQEQLEQLLQDIPASCTLVAVSKTKPVSDIKAAYEVGQRDFGENKVQELVDKAPQLPEDVRWHMIGHLQRNKVKYIAPFVHLIHGVDSPRLLREINKQGEKNNRKIDCLLQVHIASEQTKFGFDEDELQNLLQGDELDELKFVKVKGLMGMATFTSDNQVVRSEFQQLKALFDQLATKPQSSNIEMTVLSMGMSGDYTIAIEEGSNMIRVGSRIFGERS